MTTERKAVELKPCPGCDGSDIRVIGGPGTKGGPQYWAGCAHCRWRAWGNTEAEAIAAWNTRALESAGQGEDDAWKPSNSDYDRAIHSNPDASAWADLFVATFPGLADKRDLMLGWFANAMMAMHDHVSAKPVTVTPEVLMAVASFFHDGPVRDWRVINAIEAYLDSGEAAPQQPEAQAATIPGERSGSATTPPERASYHQPDCAGSATTPGKQSGAQAGGAVAVLDVGAHDHGLRFLDGAQAAISQLRQTRLGEYLLYTTPPAKVPAGWKLVPVEATEAMAAAWLMHCPDDSCRHDATVDDVTSWASESWAAMLAAAPAPKEGV